MSPSKMSVIALFLGSLATGVFADGHLSTSPLSPFLSAQLTKTTAEEEHTETAMPQEIGTMTSDGSSPRVTRFSPELQGSPRGTEASQSYQSYDGGLADPT